MTPAKLARWPTHVGGLPEWADADAGAWWQLDKVQVLPQAIPVARGQLGLWRLDPDLAEQLAAW